MNAFSKEVEIAAYNQIMDLLTLFMCPTLAKRILNVILLLAAVPRERIVDLTATSDRTLRQLKKDMCSKNMEDIFTIKSSRKEGKLAGYEQQILDELEKNNYHCIKQIIAMIKEKFNINTSQSGVQRFLKKHSLKYLKSGSIPAKANPEEQFSFYKTILKPLIAKAKAKVPKIVLFSMDASHHVLGANYLGNIYGKTRRFITTFSGRKRYNVLGAINLISKKILTVTNDTYITATQVCELLELIAKEYAGKTIYILLDNARYQKCNLVKELAEKLKINLVFIPPYSPNLNPIERFWKHVKKRLRSRYFDDFSIFKKTIDDIVDCASTDDKKAIDKLITFKFQLFDKFKQINNIAFVEDVKKKVKKHQK